MVTLEPGMQLSVFGRMNEILEGRYEVGMNWGKACRMCDKKPRPSNQNKCTSSCKAAPTRETSIPMLTLSMTNAAPCSEIPLTEKERNNKHTMCL